mgnify:FL=1
MVSIDTVYQRVLAIANKEQRGYITPQEFNLFANQAQSSIFEQYFYEVNQFGRVPKNSTEYSNLVDIVDDKIAPFKKRENAPFALGSSLYEIPAYVYKLGTVMFLNPNGRTYIVDEVKEDEYVYIIDSPLTKPNRKRPVYVRFAHNILAQEIIQVYPTITTGIQYTYIKKPSNVNWGYVVVDGKALYDATIAIDFELHPSEEKELVLKILALCGILLKEASLYQLTAAEQQKSIQQEKQ